MVDQVVAVTHTVAARLPLVRPVARVGHGLLVERRALAPPQRVGLRAPARPRRLLTTYALVSLLALLPVTPGGLGLVEGVAIPLLVSFGTPHDSALLGVLTWRLFGFWLTIPLGLAAYLWLRATGPAPARHGTSAG
jgi:hypothetical protein